MTTTTPAPPPARRRARTRGAAVGAVVALVLALALGAAAWAMTHRDGVQTAGSDAPRVLGTPPAGWFSGAWTGNAMTAAGQARFGDWRGRTSDVAITYPERNSFDQIAASEWHISTFDGFPGRLVYGLPLLPENSTDGTLREVADGRHDDTWRTVARLLVQHGRGDAVVRIGWEANGSEWYRWGATAATAPDYRAAYRHVAQVLRAEAPGLVLDFDVACGTGLAGSTDRTAALTALYPGDDVVDVIGCDMYDAWKTHATSDAGWRTALRPADTVGLDDVREFARAHHKQFAVPEWGLWKADRHGGGDNPEFITRMHDYFTQHARDLAFEAYFDEPAEYIQASICADPTQNPRSATVYRLRWSGKP